MLLTGLVGVCVEVAAVHVSQLCHVDGTQTVALPQGQTKLLAHSNHLHSDCLVRWLVGWLVGRSVACLFAWSVAWLAGSLVGYSVGRSVGQSFVSRLVGRSVGWLIGWLVGWYGVRLALLVELD